MNEEIIYQYPAPEYDDEFEKLIAGQRTANRKMKRKALVSFIISIALLILYCVPAFISFDSWLLLAAVLFMVAAMIFLKGNIKISGTHNLKILAADDHMKLTYYTDGLISKRVLQIRYEDIIEAEFFDKTYTKIQFLYRKNKHTFLKTYDKNGDEIDNTNDNLVSFELNKMSYEQGFFMYVAPELFTIKKYAVTDKIIQKYGNKDEYFSALKDSSDE